MRATDTSKASRVAVYWHRRGRGRELAGQLKDDREGREAGGKRPLEQQRMGTGHGKGESKVRERHRGTEAGPMRDKERRGRSCALTESGIAVWYIASIS